MVQDEVMLPSTVVTVIVAIPALTPTTFPLEETVATVGSLVVQVTLLLVALVGAMISFKLTLAPTFTVALLLFRLTPVTGIGGATICTV